MVVFGGFGNDRHVFSPKVVVLFVHAFPRRLCDGRVARIHCAFSSYTSWRHSPQEHRSLLTEGSCLLMLVVKPLPMVESNVVS